MNVNYIIFLFIFTLVFIILKLEYNRTIYVNKTAEINENKEKNYLEQSYKNSDKNIKTILFWDTYYGDNAMNLALGRDIFKNCEFNNCMTTNNKSYLPEDAFDAIVFHSARWNHKTEGLPTKRDIHQKYIFFSWESPYNTHFDEDFNKNFYNLTMTYRRDSDIYYPYGHFKISQKNYSATTVEQVSKRTNFSAWLVSNCVTEGTKRRQRYIKELQKYISVDIYGGCGTLKCETDCYSVFEQNYKFYLSFENSMCQDYITEKMYNVLGYDVVPVVLGFADYKAFAPTYSVIDTKDFATPKKLAEYLIMLSENLEEYLKYFEWKSKFEVVDSKELCLCNLCKTLNKPLTFSWYEDVKDWYFGYNKCYV